MAELKMDITKMAEGFAKTAKERGMFVGCWIPVSERLPEDSQIVLFSTKTDRVYEGRYFADNTDRQWYSFRDETFAWNNVVTAWCELPTPYEGGTT